MRRLPEPGRVKTRLIPTLGPEGAVRLHRRLALRTLRTAEAACRACGAQGELHFDAGDQNRMQSWLGDNRRVRLQAAGDLGRRMPGVFEEVFRDNCGAIILIGRDCPGLSREILSNAFKILDQNQVVLEPATDGGYYLVGLVRPIPVLFCGISWGGERVLTQSLNKPKANRHRAGIVTCWIGNWVTRLAPLGSYLGWRAPPMPDSVLSVDKGQGRHPWFGRKLG